MKEIFDVLQCLNNLKYVKRIGPNLFAGIPSESLDSIAGHSFRVSSIVLLLCSKFKGEINVGNLLTGALIHDWSEAIIGDIPSRSRSYQSYFDQDIRQVHKFAENKATQALIKDGDIDVPELSDLERDILEIADCTAVIFELVDLKQKGNTHKWIFKMYNVEINIIRNFHFDFISSYVSELDRLFAEGMDNKYLTKATNK
ncbi:HD domain-containing protein [Candidatus Dojkabacteria bacterium]|nr:HD domain-containing protein [Candidatus Dojkabacteria bacterium]